MREFVNLVDTVASSYLRGIRLLIFGALVLALIVFLFLAYAAPVVVEEVGERAENISDKAIDAAREEQRAAAMADEGWGYSDTTASSADGRAADYAETSGDDWATASD